MVALTDVSLIRAKFSPPNDSGSNLSELQTLNPKLNNPLSEQVANYHLSELSKAVFGQLAKEGIVVPEKNYELPIMLAMSANAFMPNTYCSVVPDNFERMTTSPPDVELQQSVCRYFREHPELMDKLAEGVALSIYCGNPTFWIGTPALTVSPNGVAQIGGQQLEDPITSGTVFVPGCGLTSLRMIREVLKEINRDPGLDCKDIKFTLCDNDPFVGKVAERLIGFMADPKAEFFPCSMEAAPIRDDLRLTLFSYVDPAGSKVLSDTIGKLASLPHSRILVVAGTEKCEHSDLTSVAFREILEAAKFVCSFEEVRRCYSTHFKEQGRSVDFLDLNREQLSELYFTELAGTGTSESRSWMSDWRSSER